MEHLCHATTAIRQNGSRCFRSTKQPNLDLRETEDRVPRYPDITYLRKSRHVLSEA
ncbi:hypothetical protein GA0061093_13421 [Rhodococcus qingshengii]|jgi:hypothetical protein|nr:hypothetical protein GA0061093_13421 [Rhodococcus qingshengii]